MPNYLDIKSVSEGYESIVKQELKFRTGKFVWRIFFNIPLNPVTVNSQNLTVFNSQKKVMGSKITYSAESRAIEIETTEPYSQGEVYTLHISRQVESKGGQKLKKEIEKTV